MGATTYPSPQRPALKQVCGHQARGAQGARPGGCRKSASQLSKAEPLPSFLSPQRCSETHSHTRLAYGAVAGGGKPGVIPGDICLWLLLMAEAEAPA